jgi:hypothetical protein
MNRLMKSVLLLAAALLVSPLANAQPMPGPHPAYLHALTDLRHARAHLERPANVKMTVAWDENVAVREIDAAIKEIKDAAIDDGKNLGDHPMVDAHMEWGGRLHKSVELLRAARRDVEGDEDNGFAHGLRRRAFEHIDAAIRFTEQAIAQNHY